MKILKYLLFSLCLLILFTCHAQAKNITFMTHFISPFTYEEKGELKGFAVDIIKEMMKDMNHPVKFKMVPFKRGLRSVQNNSNYALFIVAKRPEREETVKWVGPLISNKVYFYKLRNSPIKITNLEEAKELTHIGVGRGNADHIFLKAKGFKNLIPSNNQMQSLQMLAKERVDITPINEIVMPNMAKKAGIDPNIIERTDLFLYESTLFLVFSKDTPDDIVNLWQKSLDMLKSSGRYQEIYERYIR